MKKTLIILTTLLIVPIMASAQITIDLRSEKEVTVEENGQQITRIVPTDMIEPGQEIIYTLTYTNTGAETASNVVINDPIPETTSYVAGSATGDGSDISFSIDGGASFKKSAMLTYTVDLASGQQKTRIATPEEYTHIRWTISEIQPGETGKVSFRVKVN